MNSPKPNSSRLFERYPELRACEAELHEARDILVKAYRADKKLLVCGNGGSAADCEHIVGELMKSFLRPRRLPRADAEKLEAAGEMGASIASKLQGTLPAISLVSHVSLNTAIANDTAAEMIFAQQVYGFGRPGDVLLAISTSGNSNNVIAAAVTAKTFGLRSIALTGAGGGKLASLSDVAIRVPADTVIAIQELHLPVYHWLCVEVEEQIFGTPSF